MVPQGVYAAMPGPTYETPAEVRMLRAIGADVVGMSTVPEAIVARHGGMEVMALAIVANWAAGMTEETLSHAEVEDVVSSVASRVAGLLERVVPRI
jgi:purine-nucleoside phosphorylase